MKYLDLRLESHRGARHLYLASLHLWLDFKKKKKKNWTDSIFCLIIDSEQIWSRGWQPCVELTFVALVALNEWVFPLWASLYIY